MHCQPGRTLNQLYIFVCFPEPVNSALIACESGPHDEDLIGKKKTEYEERSVTSDSCQ